MAVEVSEPLSAEMKVDEEDVKKPTSGNEKIVNSDQVSMLHTPTDGPTEV